MLIYDKVGTADQTTSFVGGEAAAADRRKELIAKSGELSGPLIDARAEGGELSLRSLLVIFGLLLLLFGAAWVFWRRHGARSSH
jgi:hypothetical protein